MSIVRVLQILLYLLGIALLIVAASPPGQGRRWRIELLGWAAIVAAFAMPILATSA